jgi:ferredoxin-fold anticodon binding domain-containing protein
LTYICEHNKKIILIGDDCQIPAPSQQIVKDKAICYKPNSYAFSLENVSELREIVRQQAGSAILQIATFLRDNIDQELDLLDILSATGVDPGEVCIEVGDLYDQFVEDYRSGMDARIITYTNSSVRAHNMNVRKALGYDEPLVIGELLTGYTNIGFPVVVLENGSDYKVTIIKPIRGYSIAGYEGLCGKLVDIVDMEDPSHVSRDLFFISITHSENAKFLTEFVRRAERVNMRGSTKNDFKNYCALKNRCIFLENIFKFGEAVLSETDMRQQHPLLFTKVSDVINTKTRAIAISELTKKLEDMYGEIVEGRLMDNKSFSDGETFSDAYMIVERDCYYGYCLTAHKCQGSTYDSAYVLEDDFRKISNRWNYRVRAVEQRHIERNQLRYVSYTRPREKLRIVV